MKAVTGNRLCDGAVVYLKDDDQWTVHIAEAAPFQNDDGEAVLKAAQTRVGEITEAYLIDIADDGAPSGRQALRETIRTAGPTVRVDLGVQAGRV